MSISFHYVLSENVVQPLLVDLASAVKKLGGRANASDLFTAVPQLKRVGWRCAAEDGCFAVAGGVAGESAGSGG